MTSDEAARGELVAVYGSLMRGLGALDEIGVGDRLRFVGPCVIEGQLFDLGEYPGLRRGTTRVVGEIHAVLDPTALEELDRFEGFEPDRPQASLYLRERVRLVEPTGMQAWIYVYNRVPDPSRCIEGGDWRAHLARRSNPETQPDADSPPWRSRMK